MATAFKLHQIAGGIWMAEARGTASTAVSNAALIDLGDRTMVVDTFMTRVAADELAQESLRLTGRRPFLVVNSHWHSDHIGGNRVFADAAIVGTARMRELIAGDAPTSREQFERAAEDLRGFAAKTLAGNPTGAERAQAEGFEALAAALISDEDGHRVVLPNVLMSDGLELEGERAASLLSHGRGHTESDIFVHIPDAGVVIAGDLVWTGVHPKTNDGFPREWAAVLREIDRLGAGMVIPGHGPPGDSDSVRAMARYMSDVAELVDQVRAGADPAAVDAPQGSENWADINRFRVGLAHLASVQLSE